MNYAAGYGSYSSSSSSTPVPPLEDPPPIKQPHPPSTPYNLAYLTHRASSTNNFNGQITEKKRDDIGNGPLKSLPGAAGFPPNFTRFVDRYFKKYANDVRLKAKYELTIKGIVNRALRNGELWKINWDLEGDPLEKLNSNSGAVSGRKTGTRFSAPVNMGQNVRQSPNVAWTRNDLRNQVGNTRFGLRGANGESHDEEQQKRRERMLRFKNNGTKKRPRKMPKLSQKV